MRILHVTRSIDPSMGGPVEFLRLVTEAHNDLGCVSEIVTLDPPKSDFFDGWAVQVTGGGPASGPYGRSVGFERLLKAAAKDFGVIIVHGLWQYHGLCARRVALSLCLPYFLFPHGMLDGWFKKAFPIKHLKKQLYWWATERRNLMFSKRVLFTAEHERLRSMHTFWPTAPTLSEILPLGVKPAPLNREPAIAAFYERFTNLRDRPFLLSLGRLHPKKGIDLAIQATGQNSLVIVGPEEDSSYVQYLKKLAKGLPVTFTGRLWGDLKVGALAAADALILPSHQENFGLVIAEALSFGLPVLISDQMPMADEVERRGAGLVEPDTLEGADQLVKRWMQCDQDKMRIAALKCFTELFDIKQTALAMLEIIRRC